MTLPKEGRVAVMIFLTGQISGMILQLLSAKAFHGDLKLRISILVLFSLATQIALLLAFRRHLYVALCSAGLSFGANMGLTAVCLSGQSWNAFIWGLYILLLCFFHWSEYVTVAVTNPHKLKLDSFLLNHSVEYWLAAVASWTEFAIEVLLAPNLKARAKLLSVTGLLLCMLGEALRKAAMLTAGSNFTHVIALRHARHHELVTRGVYALCRHPSYLGWFAWSIGTQLLLVNPVCAVAYAVVSWRFFNERIYGEEMTLLNFFGEDYVRYQKRVPSGIPLVRGFVPLDDKL